MLGVSVARDDREDRAVKQHTYNVRVDWTGNDGQGTKTYKGYRRDHTIAAEGKAQIAANDRLEPSGVLGAHREAPELARGSASRSLK